MDSTLTTEVKRAISAEIKLQECYRNMAGNSASPKIQALLHDLLLMEEMNEVLLRLLDQSLQS